MLIESDIKHIGIYQTATGVLYRCDLHTREYYLAFWGPIDYGTPKETKIEIEDSRESTAVKEVRRFLGEGSFVDNYFEV